MPIARVQFSRFLSRSTDSYILTDVGYRNPELVLLYYSETAYLLKNAGVRWHDDADHCRTWADGCRCDVEGL